VPARALLFRRTLAGHYTHVLNRCKDIALSGNIPTVCQRCPAGTRQGFVQEVEGLQYRSWVMPPTRRRRLTP
jgi:hypothetical protein